MKWRKANVFLARLLVTLTVLEAMLLPITAFPSRAEKLYVDANLIQAYTPHVSELYSINNTIPNGCYKPKIDELDNIMEIASKRYRYASVYGGYFDVDNTPENNLGVTQRAVEVLGPDILLDSEAYQFTDDNEMSAIGGTYVTSPVITENSSSTDLLAQTVSLDTAIMNIYKAMGINLYDYKFKIERGTINKETSPAIKGLPGTIRDVDGYKTYVFITRTNPVLYKEKYIRDNPNLSSRSVSDSSKLTISEFFILLRDMMEYYGEPIMTDQEMYELMQAYGADIPTYLDDEGRRAYLYLKSRGIISDTIFVEDLFNPIKKNEMIDVLMRVADENSRETYKNIQLTKSIDSELVSKGYYPKTVSIADFDNAITVDERTIYEDATYYDYLIKIDENTEFKNIVGVSSEILYVSNINANGTTVEDTTYIGRENEYYHFSIPIKYPKDALLSNFIVVDSSDSSDKPAMLLLPQGGGIYTFDSKSDVTGMVRLKREAFDRTNTAFENYVDKETGPNSGNKDSNSSSDDENEDDEYEDDEDYEDEEYEDEDNEEDEDDGNYSDGNEELPEGWDEIYGGLPESNNWSTLPDDKVFMEVLKQEAEYLYGLDTYAMASHMIGEVNELFYKQYKRDMSNDEWDKTFTLLEQWIIKQGLGSDIEGYERNWGPLKPERESNKSEEPTVWKVYAWVVDKISSPFCMTAYAATNKQEYKINNADNIMNREDVKDWLKKEEPDSYFSYSFSTKIMTIRTAKFTKEEILSKCIIGMKGTSVGDTIGGTGDTTQVGQGNLFSTDAILSINGENALVRYQDLVDAGLFKNPNGQEPQESPNHVLRLFSKNNGTVTLNNKLHLIQVGTVVYRVPEDTVLFKKVLNDKGQAELMVDFRAAYGWSAQTVSFVTSGTGSSTTISIKPRTSKEQNLQKTFDVTARVQSSPQTFKVKLHSEPGSSIHKLVLSGDYPIANWVLYSTDKGGTSDNTLFVFYPEKLFTDNGMSVTDQQEAENKFRECFGVPITLGSYQMRAIPVTSEKRQTPGSISFDDDVGFTYVLPNDTSFTYKKYADKTYYLPMTEKLSTRNTVSGVNNRNLNVFDGCNYGSLPVNSAKTVACEPAPVGIHVLAAYGMNTDDIAKTVSSITGGSQGSVVSGVYYAGTMAVDVKKGANDNYYLQYKNGGTNVATLETKVSGETKFYLATQDYNYNSTYVMLADGITLNLDPYANESDEPPRVIGSSAPKDKFGWYKELTFNRLINNIDNFMSILLLLTIYVMPLIFFSLGTVALGLAFIIRIKIVQLFCEKVFDPVKLVTLFQSDYRDWGVGKSFKCLMVYYIMCFFLLKGNIILIIQFIWEFFRGIGQMFGFM